MRRILKNKFSILLIIIIAIFTLSSYIFDQMVIREEDNLRVKRIKFDNLNTKLNKLNAISTQLLTASSSGMTIHLKRYKNYWLKSILLITDYQSIKTSLKDEEIIDSFNDNPKYLEDLVKSRNIEHYKAIVIALNTQIERLYDIYGFDLEFFPQYQEGNNYNGPDIEYFKIFNQNKDIFYENDFNLFGNDIDESEIDESQINNGAPED